MAYIDDLHDALIKADAAGNKEDAYALADEIRKLSAPPAVTATDRAQAAGAGANIGIAGMLGFPVDVANSAIETAKMGGRKLLGDKSWLEPTPPDQVIGSSSWLAKQYENQFPGATTPNRPDDTASRYLYAAGMGAPSAVTGGGSLANVAANVLPPVAAQATHEFLPNSEAAPIIAQLATSLGPAAAKQALAAAVAGDRPAMQARIADAEASNSPLTLGQATGRPTLMGAENLVANSPVGSERFKNIAEQQATGMQSRLNQIASQLDEARPQSETLTNTGRRVQSGLEGGFKSANAAQEDALLAELKSKIPNNYRYQPENTLEQTAKLNNPAPNDIPELAAKLKSGEVSSYTDILSSAADQGGVTFPGLWGIRKDIGANAFGGPSAIYDDAAKAKLQSLYGPLTKDLESIAAKNDALPEWKGYQTTTASNRQLAEALNPYVNKATPEAAVRMAEQDLSNNPSRFMQLQQALNKGDPGAYGGLAGEIVSRMGKASPGMQDAEANKFSIAKFLTNAAEKRKNSPEAISNLFNGVNGGDDILSEQFNPMLRNAEVIKDSANWLKNNSGTAHVGAAMGTVAAGANAIADKDAGTIAKLAGALLGVGKFKDWSTDQALIKRVANGESSLTDRQLLAKALQSLTVQKAQEQNH